MTALLEVGDARVTFGGVMAVAGVSIEAEPGRITGLIGPNGAGKTTLFNIITGVQPPDSGHVHFDGREVTHLPPYRRARLGMARTFQRLELFSSLSVMDNVRAGAEIARRRQPAALAESALARVGMLDHRDEVAGSLPTGSARLVEVARALAAEPRLLLLDEPASGLDETETHELGALLRDLAAEGLGVLLVEHDMSLVMDVCDQVHVMDLGVVIASGNPGEVQRDPAVIEAYLGAV